MRRRVRGGAIGAALGLAACAGPLPVTGPVPPARPVEVACCAVPGPPVDVTYLGVGGWLVRRGTDAVLFAPLFSNPSLLQVGTGRIAGDTARIADALRALDVDLGDVGLILSGHGHYDHLMDVPHLMERYAPRARALVNGTSARQLAPWDLGDRVQAVDGEAGDAVHPGRWIRRGAVRVLPIRSRHGPHFDGRTFFRGSRERAMATPPETAPDWLDGEALAFLVDFLDGDRVAFRVYYQDAVAADPDGRVAPEVLGGTGGDARPVDLALLVPATFAEVPWHPEATVDALRPRHVLLGHWEDFFRSPLEPPVPLFLDDLPHFVARLRRALAVTGAGGDAWHLPAPGARFRFR